MSTTGPQQSPQPDGGLPAYAGTADRGVRESVPASDPMVGSAASVVQAENAKLYDLLGLVVAHLDSGDVEAVRQRWFGVVREALEYQVALGRVLLPVVPEDERALLEEDRSALVDWLSSYDAMDATLDLDDVRLLCADAVDILRRQADALLPRLQELDAAERDRLGEDLRQVMG